MDIPISQTFNKNYFKSFLPEQVTGYREWKSNSITSDLKMPTSSDDVRSFLHLQYPSPSHTPAHQPTLF